MTNADLAKLSELDAVCDAQPASAHSASELFAVADVLDAQAALRRALSDPASSAQARVALGTKVFASKIQESAQAIVASGCSMSWRNGSALSDAIERQGIRMLLRVAQDANELDATIDEVFQAKELIGSHRELRESLRDSTFSLRARQDLVSGVFTNSVNATTEALLRRGVNARHRNVTLTLEDYLAIGAQLRDRSIATVTLARPIDEAAKARLVASLSRNAGRPIDLQINIDPSVLGGIRVEIGADRIDSTFAGRLEAASRLLTT